MTNLASAWLNAGVETVRVGTGHTKSVFVRPSWIGQLTNSFCSVAPYQVFTTSDSFVMIGIGNDVQWQRLCQVLDRSEWASAPEYITNSERVKNKAKLSGAMTEVLMGKTSQEWADLFRGKG